MCSSAAHVSRLRKHTTVSQPKQYNSGVVNSCIDGEILETEVQTRRLYWKWYLLEIELQSCSHTHTGEKFNAQKPMRP